MGLIRWNSVPPEDLILIFTEFYQLSQRHASAQDYAKLPFNDRMAHIDAFAGSTSSDQNIVEQIYTLDPHIASLNQNLYCPIFSVFAQLCENFRNYAKNVTTVTHADPFVANSFDLLGGGSSMPGIQSSASFPPPSCDLARLIVEDLFIYSFCWNPSPSLLHSNPQAQRWVQHLKQGALRAV